MRGKVVIAAVVACLGLLAGSAWANGTPGTLSWQAEPVLGYGASWNGDILVDTGPVPFTIPHDAEPLDLEYNPLHSPSVSTFYVGQSVGNGSGVYVESGHSYLWTSTFMHGLIVDAGASGSDTYTDEGDGYVMLASWDYYPAWGYSIPLLTAADVGSWTYRETWTDSASGASITSTMDFQVEAVPEPVTMFSAFMAISSLGMYIRKRIKRQATV